MWDIDDPGKYLIKGEGKKKGSTAPTFIVISALIFLSDCFNHLSEKIQKLVDKQQNVPRGGKSEKHTPKLSSLYPDTKSPKQTQPCSSGNHPHQRMGAGHGGGYDRPSQESLHSEMGNRPHNYQGPKTKRKWTESCSTEAYYYNESPPGKCSKETVTVHSYCKFIIHAFSLRGLEFQK